METVLDSLSLLLSTTVTQGLIHPISPSRSWLKRFRLVAAELPASLRALQAGHEDLPGAVAAGKRHAIPVVLLRHLAGVEAAWLLQWLRLVAAELKQLCPIQGVFGVWFLAILAVHSHTPATNAWLVDERGPPSFRRTSIDLHLA